MAQQQITLPTTHGGVRTIISSNATDAEARLAKADKCRVGFADFNDLATQTTPLSFDETDGWVLLTNDKLGPFTNVSFLPEGITSSVLTANQFDFSELKIGDMINGRADVVVTTTVPNQEVAIRAKVGIGSPSEFVIPMFYGQYKSAGTYQINPFNGIYIGSNDIKNNPAQFEISSDDACSVKVNGWFMQFLLRGEAA